MQRNHLTPLPNIPPKKQQLHFEVAKTLEILSDFWIFQEAEITVGASGVVLQSLSFALRVGPNEKTRPNDTDSMSHPGCEK